MPLHTSQVSASFNIVDIRGGLEEPNLKLTCPFTQSNLIFTNL